MRWDDTLRRTADMARPYSIYATGTTLVLGPFLHADFSALGITLTAFLALIGARGVENVAQIKATADVAKSASTSQTITPTVVTTATQGAPPTEQPK